MCIAIPREVLSIDGLIAEVATERGPQPVLLNLLSEPVAVGDYVTLQAGRYAVSRMDAREAHVRLALFDELLETSTRRETAL